MPDYGHNLQFGAFITPSTRQAHEVVTLARHAEETGLDLVTFQDHPYNPDLLDAFTLMTWVAAQTRTIRIAGNVLNLPLRPPAMLARAASTLDLLSQGRFEMGLGAGAFWDPMAGMGATRRTPGESVRQLSEGIDVLREFWREEGTRRAKYTGDFYAVPGAIKGPLPAHRIEIWLGAYKKKMLELIGAKGDGWLPSLGYLDIADAGSMNATIDGAAAAAGRNPREIRRLLNLNGRFMESSQGFLNGPVEQWISEISMLALQHGFGTFIISADDAPSIERFATEVAPAVRERVAEGRARSGIVTGRVRANAALAKRREGIDYDGLPKRLQEIAVEPGDFGYSSTQHGYIWNGQPGLVLRAETRDDVVAAVHFARRQPVDLAVRSGGHGISGRSTNDGGIVIDLARMNAVDVLDRESGLVRIEAGADWGSVAAALAPVGLALSSGDSGDVGVGGLATTGGIGFMSRHAGLTIDRMVAAEIVTADGAFHRVDENNDPDLYWAIRGAGGNMGIVTAFEFRASRIGDVVFGITIVDATDAAPMLEKWARLVEDAPRELTSFMTMVPARDETPAIAQIIIVYASDDIPAASDALTPFFRDLGPALQQQAQLMPYAAIVAPYNGEHAGTGRFASRSALAEHVTPRIAHGLAGIVANRESPFVQIRAVGGAVNDVPADATAYAHRHQNFALSATSSPASIGPLDRSWARMEPDLDGLYLSFDTRTDDDVLREAFPAATLARLREIKARVDPDNVFNRNFAIAPESVIAL